MTSTASGRWRARAQQPIILRLPTGIAIVLALTSVLLLVLAYWAGQTRGRRYILAQSGQSEVVATLFHPVDSVTSDMRPAAGLQPPPDDRLLANIAPKDHTARTVGHNYFVLAHYPQADAQRLVNFLDGHGVDTAAFKQHNGRLFQVVALRGFRRQEITGPDRQEFEQKLRQLGRTWKNKRYGPDFSQTGIYLDRFENETIVETLTVKEDPS